jgi:hypothetical protein
LVQAFVETTPEICYALLYKGKFMIMDAEAKANLQLYRKSNLMMEADDFSEMLAAIY